MIKIYGPLETRTLRCLWTAHEAGIEFEHVDLNMKKGENKAPDFLQICPTGKVPAMTDGELCLFESAAICNYIAAQVPEKNLIPQDGTKERGQFDQWNYYVMSELEQPLWTMAKHKFALPAEKRIPQMQEVAQYEFSVASQLVDNHLKDRTFMVGEQFTVADIMVAHTYMWAYTFKVPFNSSRLEQWVKELRHRPSFRKMIGKL